MEGLKRLKVIYGYQDFFKRSLPEDTFFLLRKYATKNILVKIANMNAIIYSLKQQQPDRRIFEEVLFGKMPIVQLLLEYLNNDKSNGSFFASMHLSELIKDSLNNYNESQTQGLPYEIFAIELFETILIYNDKYNDKPELSSSLTSFRDVFSLDISQQYYIRASTPIIYLYKFAFMCKFLCDDNELRNPTIEFCQNHGMASPWAIAKFLITLYTNTGKKNEKFVLEKTAIPAEFLKDWTIGKEYLTQKEELTLNFYVIPRPLFEYSNEELIILDFNFFQYTVDQGFFYKIFEKTLKSTGLGLGKFNNFKSYLGTEYFENFLCKSLLQKVFSNKQQIVHTSQKYQDFLVKTSSDNLLLIETKMTDVNAKTLENIDFYKFKKNIEENFINKKEIDGKNKGVYQLLHQLKQISDDDNQSEVSNIFKIKKVKRLNIYPIILTSDSNYNVHGANAFVNEICSIDFEKMKEKFQTIRPVLILNVDTLIKYYGYFKSDKNNFTNLIKSYFIEITRQKKKYDSDKNEIYSYLASSISFDSYLQIKLKHLGPDHLYQLFSDDFSTELSGLDFTPSQSE